MIGEKLLSVPGGCLQGVPWHYGGHPHLAPPAHSPPPSRFTPQQSKGHAAYDKFLVQSTDRLFELWKQQATRDLRSDNPTARDDPARESTIETRPYLTAVALPVELSEAFDALELVFQDESLPHKEGSPTLIGQDRLVERLGVLETGGTGKKANQFPRRARGIQGR